MSISVYQIRSSLGFCQPAPQGAPKPCYSPDENFALTVYRFPKGGSRCALAFDASVVIVAVALAGIFIGRVSKSAEPGAADVAVRLAQEMAAAASRRDVASNAKLIPQTDRVAYVSNGHPVTGRQYAETLGPYYALAQEPRLQVGSVMRSSLIGERAAVFTGWANVKTVDQKGGEEAAKALFTMVFADDGSGWNG